MRDRAGGWSAVLLACAVAPLAPGQAPPSAATTPFTGVVIDETGAPIAGAAVGDYDLDDFVDVAALLANPPHATGTDGAFALSTGRTRCRIVVASKDRQACSLQILDLFGPPPRQLGYVVLVPGTRLVGRVRDDAGAPLAGVRIAVESSFDLLPLGAVHQSLLSGAVSNDQGIFVVPCVPRTGMRIRAMADGFATESRLAAQHAPPDLRLQRTGFVRGKVVDRGGAPVAGVRVYAVTVQMPPRVHAAFSADDGTFVVTAPPAQLFRIVGSCAADPLRTFASALLKGPRDEVVVVEGGTGEAATLAVEVVRAKDGARIERFLLSSTCGPGQEPALQMYSHYSGRRAYAGTAVLRYARTEQRPTRIVVDAEGCAFARVDVPEQLDGPLRIALEPEASLEGVVRDATTNAPMAGVAVRALPKGDVMSTGCSVEACWPRTDADGRYRIGGLQPGDYQVQAYGPGRPSSSVAEVKVAAEAGNWLDLVVPRERWIHVEFTGDVPEGTPCVVSLGLDTAFSGASTRGFEVAPPDPAPQLLEPGKVLHFGPLGRGSQQLAVFVPSRTTAGAGITMGLGRFVPNDTKQTRALPRLSICHLRGHVDLPSDVPTERVGLIARRPEEDGNAWLRTRPGIAALDGDTNFVIDLPAGNYRLQLVDLETDIVFHTENEDVAVKGDDLRVTLKPEIHWLEIALAPERQGDEPTLRSFGVVLPHGPDGHPAMLHTWSSPKDGVEEGEVEIRRPGDLQRWLVPAVSLRVHGVQNFDILRRGAQGWGVSATDEVTVDCTRPVQRVTLKVPAAPSDEELEQGR